MRTTSRSLGGLAVSLPARCLLGTPWPWAPWRLALVSRLGGLAEELVSSAQWRVTHATGLLLASPFSGGLLRLLVGVDPWVCLGACVCVASGASLLACLGVAQGHCRQGHSRWWTPGSLLGVAPWVVVVGCSWTLLAGCSWVVVVGHMTQPRCLPCSGCLLRLLSPHPLLKPLSSWREALGGLAGCRAARSATSQ